MENKEAKDPILLEIDKLDKNVKWILLIGAPILILMPILTTQLDWLYDFTNTGNIGDTIGGVTAPVIGVVSALLIYFSFRAQIAANRIIINQMKIQAIEDREKNAKNHLMEIYNHIRDSIENFQYKASNEGLLTGSPAFHKFWSIILSGQDSVQIGSSKTFENILKLFEVVSDELKTYKDKKIDVELVMFLTELQFNQNIWESYSQGVINGTVKSEKSNSLRLKVEMIERIQNKIAVLKTL